MSCGITFGDWPSDIVSPVEIWPLVAPSAPGNVPKRLSNDRFSLRMNTMCWIDDWNAATWEAGGVGLVGCGQPARRTSGKNVKGMNVERTTDRYWTGQL